VSETLLAQHGGELAIFVPSVFYLFIYLTCQVTLSVAENV
jgi:hypothetical protein